MIAEPVFYLCLFLVLLDAHHALFQSEALQLQLNLSEEIRNSQELRLQVADESHEKNELLFNEFQKNTHILLETKSRAVTLLNENEFLQR